MNMRIGMTFAIAAASAVAVFTPGDANATTFDRREPATMCFIVSGAWTSSNGKISANNTGVTETYVDCPFYQDGTAVDSAVTGVSVDIYVSSGESVSTQDCIETTTGGACDNYVSSSGSGFQTIHPSLTEWNGDTNNTDYSYIGTNIDKTSTILGIYIHN